MTQLTGCLVSKVIFGKTWIRIEAKPRQMGNVARKEDILNGITHMEMSKNMIERVAGYVTPSLTF